MISYIKGTLTVSGQAAPVPVAGSIYFVEHAEWYETDPDAAGGYILSPVTHEYRGTLVCWGWSAPEVGATARLETDHGFAGDIQVHRVSPADELRSVVLLYTSAGRPERTPEERETRHE